MRSTSVCLWKKAPYSLDNFLLFSVCLSAELRQTLLKNPSRFPKRQLIKYHTKQHMSANVGNFNQPVLQKYEKFKALPHSISYILITF